MLDFEDLDHYELLGILRNASADDVKRAYRREIAKYHPDRFTNGTPEQQEYAVLRSQRINEAYQVLGNFSTRSRYSLKREARTAPTPAPAPPQQRDHLGELYEQARHYLDEGRPLEAMAALRQLQQLNPLYRDSADLLASAKAQIEQRSERRVYMPPADEPGRFPRRSIIIGSVSGVLAIAALASWALGRTPGVPTPRSTAGASASSPSEQPVATLVPTAAPTATPTPTPTPTVRPTATPERINQPTVTRLPTPVPAQPLGQLLVEESFDRRAWAQQESQSWSVGYRDGRYRIAANAGVGLIWSYRTGPTGDASYAVDVQLTGEGGLLVRFANEGEYLRCTITNDGGFRVGRAQAGSLTILAEGRSQAINSGAQPSNRLEAHLRGDTLIFMANGQTLADVRVTAPPDSPRYGLVVVSEDTNSEAFFDNLEIRAILQ
jgi:curved DNA-binding protein CbpA